MEKNKTILITGIAGLLGSRMADWIIENTDYMVIGIDDLSGGFIDNVNKKVEFHQLNLVTDVVELNNIFSTKKIDYVYHFAAYAAEGLSPFIRSFNYKNNLIATTHIINNCISHNVKRIIFTSTMAVYGNGSVPFDEDDIPNPIDPYGIAKYACEMDIRVAGEQHDLDWCIIRPHNVYGINQNIWDKYRNVLGIWMYQYMNNHPLTIFGTGEQTRSFSFIDDTLEPMWKCAVLPTMSKQIVNLGGVREYTINDACHIIQSVIGGGDVVYLEPRHEVKHAYPTYEKSVQLLGYQDKTSLKNGLTKMWGWAQKQPSRPRFVWENYEIDKHIYSYWK
jgi:UDP-glucose 4-epimerase